MFCVRTPLASPAGSEISVGGAPSPPPPPSALLRRDANDYAQPAKKHKRCRSNSPQLPLSLQPPSAPAKSKSFSIADILGHHPKQQATKPTAKQPAPPAMDSPVLMPVPVFAHPWDHLRAGLPLQHLISPALFPTYDHRIALDYQRQLEEHFHAQAQILRQMSMENMIPSESGSERSTSATSNCCSPEINNRLSADSHKSESPSAAGGSSRKDHAGHQSASGGSTNASGQKLDSNGTPLDALFQMTNKNFDESQDDSHINLFSNRPQQKKKRKSRTAFTNHQIFGLEKRFLYQKYLSPVDRDEIAASLGLTGAQVITWFQNRRAKLKRDIEELKKDVESVKVLSAAPNGYLENISDLSILKKNPTLLSA